MAVLLHELLLRTADDFPANTVLAHKNEKIDYASLAETSSRIAAGLVQTGLGRQDRVSIYLPKCPEAVAGIFATTLAGGVFVPVNPLLKAEQVGYILRDCNVRVLITSTDRFLELEGLLDGCPDLRCVILVGDDAQLPEKVNRLRCINWQTLLGNSSGTRLHRTIDADMAAIFYTSGSTGNPKGVILSHRNIVAGAKSVAEYLGNESNDRLLAVLPFSFDYGFSQLTTAFLTGASVTLMDYLFPKDVIDAVVRYRITGLAAVPPLWIQLAKLRWPDGVTDSLRYITNSGGAMPKVTLDALRDNLPDTRIFLMYGLTEAFRSTFLPPDEMEERPDSIGKAIPNAEVMVLREDGSPWEPGEPGELVHRGALVGLGYWNDPEKTAERFRQLPPPESGLVVPEMAVWSGDTVVQDDEGFLFFVGRDDDMIKTSGYRVSPSEVEEVIYATGLVNEVAAVGVPHPVLGQVIVVATVSQDRATGEDTEKLLEACRMRLPNFMVPEHVEWFPSLPRNPNGKMDRKQIRNELKSRYQDSVL